MIISLTGYMGSGKSHVARILSAELGCASIDLDKAIEIAEHMTIAEIFAQKGELYFRRRERDILHELLKKERNCILSLGGGTPAYYDNMAEVNQKSISVNLRSSVAELVERLQPSLEKRPLIAHLAPDALPEFIAKHLFERNAFYNQAHIIIDTARRPAKIIAKEIIRKVAEHEGLV